MSISENPTPSTEAKSGKKKPNRKPLTSKLQIENAEGPGRYSCGGDGLYLDVKKKGSRSFYLRVMVNRKIIERTLGSFPQLGLKEARSKARDLAAALRNGTEAKLEMGTFRDTAEAFMKKERPAWKSRVHAHQWAQTLRDYAYPVIGDMDCADIKVAHVEEIVMRKNPWREAKGREGNLWTVNNETARILISRVATVLDYAAAIGLREQDLPNPASMKGPLKRRLPSVETIVKHHAALPHTDAPMFMERLRGLNSLSAAALELTILTACRTAEVLGARWSEFDLENATWTIPAARTKTGKKTGRPHTVPLSPQALAVLERARELPSPAGWVFPNGPTHLSNMAMLQCLKGLRPDLTVHGFRSTFRDWAAECTTFSHEVCEAALAHSIGGADAKTVAAYLRATFFDKRRNLMNAWADYCDGKQPSATTAEELKAQIEALQSQLATLAA
jgi:integrase